jgi:GNAT superfamily N-acetyltransferase
VKGTDVIEPGTVEFSREDPSGELATHLLRHYFDELVSRLPEDFDVDLMLAAPAEELEAPNGAFLVARMGGRPVGCGAVRKLDGTTGEVKRMWIDPSVRGLGIGRGLLIALEEVASDLGCRRVRLDTSSYLTEALHLYQTCGYQEIDAYNDNPYAAYWFEKWFVANG